jgi:hypothetical protein
MAALLIRPTGKDSRKPPADAMRKACLAGNPDTPRSRVHRAFGLHRTTLLEGILAKLAGKLAAPNQT